MIKSGDRTRSILLCLVLVTTCGCWTVTTQRAYWDASYRERVAGEDSQAVPVPGVYVYGGAINMFPAMHNADRAAFSRSTITRIGAWAWFVLLGIPANVAGDTALLPLTIPQQLIGAPGDPGAVVSGTHGARVERVRGNALVLTVLRAHDIAPGAVLIVRRGDTLLGRISVVTVKNALLACRMQPAPGAPSVAAGDLVELTPAKP